MGTPGPIVERLRAEIAVAKWLTDMGLEFSGLPLAEPPSRPPC